MLAFRSLDPFRALREPDRRRRDEERLSRSEQRTLSKTQNNHLTGKAPYKFESGSLQRGIRNEPCGCQATRLEEHCRNQAATRPARLVGAESTPPGPRSVLLKPQRAPAS